MILIGGQGGIHLSNFVILKLPFVVYHSKKVEDFPETSVGPEEETVIQDPRRLTKAIASL